MKIIPLTRGKVAVVDDCDYKSLSKVKWFAQKNHHNFYAVRNVSLGGSKQTSVKMHQVILGCKHIDHKDGDGLNNRRSNLRVTTQAKNCMNRRRNANNTTGFKGVRFSKFHGRFQAQIQANKIKIHIGYFSTPEEAYVAYCAAASKLHGEFARFA